MALSTCYRRSDPPSVPIFLERSKVFEAANILSIRKSGNLKIRMEGVEAMEGMEGMKGKQGMEGIEGMEGMEGMGGMEGMEGMERMERRRSS